jgi:hypothetical protein
MLAWARAAAQLLVAQTAAAHRALPRLPLANPRSPTQEGPRRPMQAFPSTTGPRRAVPRSAGPGRDRNRIRREPPHAVSMVASLAYRTLSATAARTGVASRLRVLSAPEAARTTSAPQIRIAQRGLRAFAVLRSLTMPRTCVHRAAIAPSIRTAALAATARPRGRIVPTRAPIFATRHSTLASTTRTVRPTRAPLLSRSARTTSRWGIGHAINSFATRRERWKALTSGRCSPSARFARPGAGQHCLPGRASFQARARAKPTLPSEG